MKAIGRVDHVGARGEKSVTMFYDGKWQGSWILGNIMPYDNFPIGLFEFSLADQFCFWRDPNK